MEVAQSTNNSKIKISVKDSKYATGRRKTSIAKIWLKCLISQGKKRKRKKCLISRKLIANVSNRFLLKC